MRIENPPAQGGRAAQEQFLYQAGREILDMVGPAPGERGWTMKEIERAEGYPLGTDDTLIQLQMVFSALWVQGGMPKIVMGHKLAARLMASKADGEVLRTRAEAPFEAYMIELPNDLLYSDTGEIGAITVLRYELMLQDRDHGWAWLATDRAGYTIGGWGLGLEDLQSHDAMTESASRVPADLPRGRTMLQISDNESRLWGVIGRLIVGTNIYMASGTAERRMQKTTFHRRGTASQRPPVRPVYKLMRDVTIDLRGDVQRYIRGETEEVDAGAERRHVGVRFRVRGHYKMQPYGPRSSLRKLIHREPYWVGDEDAPVAVRSHDLDGGGNSDVLRSRTCPSARSPSPGCATAARRSSSACSSPTSPATVPGPCCPRAGGTTPSITAIRTARAGAW